MDWLIEFTTDDGFTIFELDARVEYSIDWDGFDHNVDVTGFEIDTGRYHPDTKKWERGKQPAFFWAGSDSLWEKHLFFHVKDMLEADEDFISAALENWEDNDIPLERYANPLHLLAQSRQ